jgi:hypothetical protein
MTGIISEKVSFTFRRRVIARAARKMHRTHMRRSCRSRTARTSTVCEDAKRNGVAHHSPLSQTYQLSVTCMLFKIELFGECRWHRSRYQPRRHHDYFWRSTSSHRVSIGGSHPLDDRNDSVNRGYRALDSRFSWARSRRTSTLLLGQVSRHFDCT